MKLVLVAIGSLPNVRVWRQNVGTVKGADGRYFRAGPPRGAADISGIAKPGIRLEIEVKTRRGRQSKEQKRWQAMIEAMGGVYVLVRGDSAADVPRAVEAVLAAMEEKNHVQKVNQLDHGLGEHERGPLARGRSGLGAGARGARSARCRAQG